MAAEVEVAVAGCRGEVGGWGGGRLFRVNLFLLCENNLIHHLSTPPAWLAGLDCVLFCPSLNNADGVAFQFGGERRFSRQVVTSSTIYSPPPSLPHACPLCSVSPPFLSHRSLCSYCLAPPLCPSPAASPVDSLYR